MTTIPACRFVTVFALVALATFPAQADNRLPLSDNRVTLPQRIGMGDEFGGSQFARSLHELSQRGNLNAPGQSFHHGNRNHSYKFYYFNTYHNPYARRYTRYYDPWWDMPYPYGVDGRVVYGVQPGSQMGWPTTPPPPPQPPQPEPEPLTQIEQARFDFESGRLDRAIDGYRAHLAEFPEEFGVAAELAVALIADGRDDDGTALLRLAYEKDPNLAFDPVSQRVSLSSKVWRDTVVRAVRHANRRDSGSSWLAVAVLMQAEGRAPVALRMLERAEHRGLDRMVVTPLAAAMR